MLKWWKRGAWGMGLCLALSLQALILANPAASAESTLERILSEKKVRICWISSPPQEMKDPKSGKVTGYFVDAARYIFDELKVESEFIEEKWGTFVASLQSGRVDFCIASAFASIKRSAVIVFTEPILYIGRSAIVKKGDTRFKKLADFNHENVTIAVIQGSRSQEFVESSLPKAKVLAIGGNDPSTPFLAVSAGRADVGINDAWTARRYARNQPNVTDLFGDEPYNVSPMAWSVRSKDIQLLNFLNTSLRWIIHRGSFEEMALKYENAGRYREQLRLVPFAVKN